MHYVHGSYGNDDDVLHDDARQGMITYSLTTSAHTDHQVLRDIAKTGN